MTQKQMLSEADAWREIARRIAEGEWLQDGLCVEVARLCDDAQITRETWLRASRRVRAHLLGGVWDADEGITRCIYAMGSELAEPRILAALWLALEAESEPPSSVRPRGEGVKRT